MTLHLIVVDLFCPLSVHLYILPYTSRSTKFSGKINDQEATFVFVFATDSILVHGVLKKIIMFFFIAIKSLRYITGKGKGS
jgi:hypothetical protein